MNVLSHHEIEELLGAYALHAVDPDEVAAVEGHLEECPRCRSEVAAHRDTATLLGNSGADAPEGLWERISSQLEEAPPPMRLNLPAPQGNVIPLAARRQGRGTRYIAAALGAAAAITVGVLGAQVVRQQDQVVRQQDQLDRFESTIAEGSLLNSVNVALRDPAAAKGELRSTDGELMASAVLLPDGTGFLMAHDLPPLEGDRTYQLWGKTDSGLISLGLLGSDPGAIVPFSGIDDIDSLAVTAEEDGGVIQSQNLAVVQGELS